MERLLTREYLITTLANFVNASNFYLLVAVTAGYAIDRFEADSATAGLVTGIFVVGALASRLVAARMLGLLSYKRTLVIGLTIALASSLFYPFAPTVGLFILVRAVHGFGFGIVVSATSTIIADIVPAERIGQGMGYYQLSATVATAIGPFVAILLSEVGNYTLIFLICTGLILLALAPVPFLRLRTITLGPEERETFRGFKLRGLIEVPALPASTLAALMYLSYAAVIAFLALFVLDLGLPGVASWFFLVYALAVIVSRPFVGRAFDRRGALPIVLPALAMLILGLVLLSLVDGIVLLVASAVACGLGAGAIQAATLATVAKITPSHRKGIGTTTYFLLADVGYSIGPILAGLMLPLLGFRGLCLMMGGVILLTLLLCITQRRRLKSDPG
ncbi:MAG: MFS transporter [Coriobacteriales bacterium]|nr:MFS transporter [Coriobacteriales bacterium]